MATNVTFSIADYCVCNNRGICLDIPSLPVPICACDSGFGGVNQMGLPDCSKTWETEYPSSFLALRSINITFDTLAWIFCLMTLLYEIIELKRAKSDQGYSKFALYRTAMRATVGNRALLVLCTFMVWLSFDWILWVVDPMSFRGTISRPVYLFMADFAIVMGSIYILALVEHLITFSTLAIATLNKEDMIMKVNRNYRSNVTLEDILDHRKKLGSLFWASIAINGILFALQIALTTLHSIQNPHYFSVAKALFSLVIVLYAIYAVSMIPIWFAFISIIPNGLRPKKTVTPIFIKVCIVSGVSAINSAVAIAVGFSATDWVSYFYYMPACSLMKYIATFVAISIHAPPEWKGYLRIFGCYLSELSVRGSCPEDESLPQLPDLEKRGSLELIEPAEA